MRRDIINRDSLHNMSSMELRRDHFLQHISYFILFRKKKKITNRRDENCFYEKGSQHIYIQF